MIPGKIGGSKVIFFAPSAILGVKLRDDPVIQILFVDNSLSLNQEEANVQGSQCFVALMSKGSNVFVCPRQEHSVDVFLNICSRLSDISHNSTRHSNARQVITDDETKF